MIETYSACFYFMYIIYTHDGTLLRYVFLNYLTVRFYTYLELQILTTNHNGVLKSTPRLNSCNNLVQFTYF